MRVCCRCGVQITADPRYVMCPGCAAWAERHASRLSGETGAELSADEVPQPSTDTAGIIRVGTGYLMPAATFQQMYEGDRPIAPTVAGPPAWVVQIREALAAATERANTLADECGRLRDENRELLAENARLRRALEKAGRR